MKTKKLLMLALCVALVMLLVGCQALVQGEDLTLEKLLWYLTTGPGIGVAIAVILEKVPFAKKLFDKILDLEWKRTAVLGMCVFLAVGAQGLRAYLGFVVLDEVALFNALAAAWEAFTTGTVLHGFIRDKNKSEQGGGGKIA